MTEQQIAEIGQRHARAIEFVRDSWVGIAIVVGMIEDVGALLAEVQAPGPTAKLFGWTKGGEFDSFGSWVNNAASWIGGTSALCVDAKGRLCRIGADFMLARNEGAFPVSYWFPPPIGSKVSEQERET